MMPYWKFRIWLVRNAVRQAFQRVVTGFHPWIHTPQDGRGPRQVYLDGELLTKVLYADTRRGVVRCHFEPARINKRRSTLRSFKRYGNVSVLRMGEM